MKKIEYYSVKIGVSLFHYDNNPALTNDVLYLGRQTSTFRFKTKKEAELFQDEVLKLAKKCRKQKLI